MAGTILLTLPGMCRLTRLVAQPARHIKWMEAHSEQVVGAEAAGPRRPWACSCDLAALLYLRTCLAPTSA